MVYIVYIYEVCVVISHAAIGIQWPVSELGICSRRVCFVNTKKSWETQI